MPHLMALKTSVFSHMPFTFFPRETMSLRVPNSCSSSIAIICLRRISSSTSSSSSERSSTGVRGRSRWPSLLASFSHANDPVREFVETAGFACRCEDLFHDEVREFRPEDRTFGRVVPCCLGGVLSEQRCELDDGCPIAQILQSSDCGFFSVDCTELGEELLLELVPVCPGFIIGDLGWVGWSGFVCCKSAVFDVDGRPRVCCLFTEEKCVPDFLRGIVKFA